ncbi:Uncharacterized protein dnl_06370 [Desulfonema limicola]|uniref:NurA domain-containing protein n=1 Tax=Desulfonema limicola TaxID=45656 RepID=A0A975GEN2_9BACT|nr:hypothetical protein [Desulfonema limicola]QTA78416.1 Uncharacterized protein dnl_06370 [Desulfonema limicola]
MKSIELAKEITATMSLRLPGTVGKIANKMRYIDARAPQFSKGRVIRPVIESKFEKIKAVGISSKNNHLQAFGGILYGAAALRQDLTIIGNKVVETFQDSRIDINDMNYLVNRQRLIWKEYLLVYTLLNELFSEPELPDIILIDLPLLVGRGEQSGQIENDDIAEEWAAVMDCMTSFWERHLSRIFPENPEGPMLVSISSRHFGAILNALREKGQDGTPEDIEIDTLELIKSDWDRMREAGIIRILKGMLRAGRRTSAYYYDALGRDALRAEPKIIADYGLIGCHAQIGIKTPIWQIETLGNREKGVWSSKDIDRLCSMIAYLTLYDNSQAMPLPLWYARRLVKMPKTVLISYLKETLRLLREQTIDAAWLEGIDELENRDQEL